MANKTQLSNQKSNEGHHVPAQRVTGETKEITDNRKERARQKSLEKAINSSSKTAQRAYNENKTNAVSGPLWAARKNMGLTAASHIHHNAAQTGAFYASSAGNSHAEGRTLMWYLGSKLGGDIDVMTERQPCSFCEADMKSLADFSKAGKGVDVNVNYMVDYRGREGQHHQIEYEIAKEYNGQSPGLSDNVKGLATHKEKTFTG